MHKKIFVVLVFLILVSSCSPEATQTPIPTSTSTPVAPTDTPIPTPTPSLTPTPTLQLLPASIPPPLEGIEGFPDHKVLELRIDGDSQNLIGSITHGSTQDVYSLFLECYEKYQRFYIDFDLITQEDKATIISTTAIYFENEIEYFEFGDSIDPDVRYAYEIRDRQLQRVNDNSEYMENSQIENDLIAHVRAIVAQVWIIGSPRENVNEFREACKNPPPTATPTATPTPTQRPPLDGEVHAQVGSG